MCLVGFLVGSHPVQGGIYQVTPLHIASQHNLFEVARLLLKTGAKLDIKDTNDKVKVYLTARYVVCF